jgi:pyruvate/2-oxoglutarate dehydrogenase complex dihydrolipoamide dehydrogenase (E3) component
MELMDTHNAYRDSQEPIPSNDRSPHEQPTLHQHSPETVVIIGGGVIGLCTAYNLALHSPSSLVKIIIIEVFDNLSQLA